MLGTSLSGSGFTTATHSRNTFQGHFMKKNTLFEKYAKMYSYLHTEGVAVVEIDLEASGGGSGPLHGVCPGMRHTERQREKTVDENYKTHLHGPCCMHTYVRPYRSWHEVGRCSGCHPTAARCFYTLKQVGYGLRKMTSRTDGGGVNQKANSIMPASSPYRSVNRVHSGAMFRSKKRVGHASWYVCL